MSEELLHLIINKLDNIDEKLNRIDNKLLTDSQSMTTKVYTFVNK